MKVTKIAKIGKQDKFAVFIDDQYLLDLDAEALLNSKLRINQEISEEEFQDLKTNISYYKLYHLSIRYLSRRLKSEGELRDYLKRKQATSDQIEPIVSRLKDLDLINDQKYAVSYIHDRMLLSPISSKKIKLELKKRKIAEDIITNSLRNDQISDIDNLKKLIKIKRKNSRYSDDLKLMQYLVRNGFNYQDVKETLNNPKY